MTLVRRVARPLMASMFLLGGYDQLRNPGSKRAMADDVAPRLAGAVNSSPIPVTLPADTDTLVRINGAAMLGAGTMLAAGRLPRVAAAVLAGTLVPTTLAGHAFWEAPEEAKAMQRLHFLKNTSMLGGLLLAMVDTEGRESLPRATKRAARSARREARRAARTGGMSTGLAVERARRRGAGAAMDARRAVGV